jgi:hypothetical protein
LAFADGNVVLPVYYKGVWIMVAPYVGRIYSLAGCEIPIRVSNDSGQAKVSLPGWGAVCAARLVLLAVGIRVPPGYLVHHVRGRIYNSIYDIAVIPRAVNAALHSVLKRRPERVGQAALNKLAAYPYVLDYAPKWKAERIRARIRALGLPVPSRSR